MSGRWSGCRARPATARACRSRPAGNRPGLRAMLGHVKRVPRPAGMLAWTLGAVAMYALVPFELSRLGGRPGLPAGGPRAIRGAGLATVTAGTGLMAWAIATHGAAAPR